MLPVKQSSGLSARPDLIAVPVDASTWRPIYSKAVAIEIESCNEVEVHPDQVAHNWVKESVRDFAEVHTWTWDRCFNRLREIYEKAGIDRGKVKIFSVKCIEAREKSGKKRETEIKRGASKQVPETGLGNAQSLQVAATATVIREEEEGAAEEEKQEIVRKFKASDGYEYIVVLSDSEAKKFDKFCTGKRIVIKVEGSAIKCVDRATGASAALSPSSLSRAS